MTSGKPEDGSLVSGLTGVKLAGMLEVQPVGKRVSEWGEGPIWHGEHLYYVDIRGEALVRFSPDSGEEREWALGQQVGCVVACRSGHFLYGGAKGLFFFDLESETSEQIVDPEADRKDHRFNDGKTSPDGRLFAGTISGERKPEAALYRLDPDLSLERVIHPVTNSNGIGWSPDGGTCYYIDTPTKEIKAFAYEEETGALHDERVCVETRMIEGSPDGLAVDENGHVWVAFCHGGCVIQFDPQEGKIIQRIEVPVVETTAVAFGGGNRRSLYITTGQKLSANEEWGGRLFMIPDAGVAGLPVPEFNDQPEAR